MRAHLSGWSFDAALFLAKERGPHFRNRFLNKKLRELHAGKNYVEYVEGIVGYMGDVGAAVALGLDLYEVLTGTIVATDSLNRRDDFDLFFNGYNLDAKIEDFAGHHARAISGSLTANDPYGCRLINAVQWNEASKRTDLYVFGCFDPPLSSERTLDVADEILWLGYFTADQVAAAPEGDRTPEGRRLPMRAKILPHGNLHPAHDLKAMPPGSRAAPRIVSLTARLAEIAGRAVPGP